MLVRLTPKVEGSVKRFVQMLRDELGSALLQVRLFGSQLNGMATWESDVDLLVVVKERNWEIEEKVSDLAYQAGIAFDVFLSPSVYSEDEYNNPAIHESPFIQKVSAEGVSL